MLIVVFGALFGTHPAHRRAQGEIGIRYFGVPLNKSCSQTTDIGAIPVQFDTSCHHGNILFIEARRCACLTRQRTIGQLLQ